MIWYKLAYERKCGLQECQESTPSSEFFGWMAFFEWQQTQERSKQDFYLAQITAEIRSIGQMFAKSPKRVSIEDCLLPLVKWGEETKLVVKEFPKDGWVETGPELVKDPKWAKVNAEAKARWEAILGPDR